MTYRLPLPVLAIVAHLIGNAYCIANNNQFLPGDAFFPTKLSHEDLDKLLSEESGKRRFSYSSLGGYDGAFCGYAGYTAAIIPSVDDKFAKNLKSVYQAIRRTDSRRLVEVAGKEKSELIETNGIQVLFYPVEFDIQQHRLGLQYNENWVNECIRFGHEREQLRLCCLIADPEAVGRSWRDAEVVAGLPAKLPDVKLERFQPLDNPIVVSGPVKAYVLGDVSLTDLYRGSARENLYTVDKTGAFRLVREERKWKKLELDDE